MIGTDSISTGLKIFIFDQKYQTSVPKNNFTDDHRSIGSHSTDGIDPSDRTTTMKTMTTRKTATTTMMTTTVPFPGQDSQDRTASIGQPV
jgi:hypothetical protein